MTIDLDKYLTFDRSKLYKFPKSALVLWLYTMGYLIAFLTTMNPWPLWKISTTYMAFSSVFIFLSMFFDRQLKDRMFSDGNYLYPTLAFIVLAFYQKITDNGNVFGLIATGFNAFIVFSFFRLKTALRLRLVTFICKCLAVFLCFSIACFFLYLFGFSFPSQSLVSPDEFYYFTNYYMFLIDDRSLLAFFPRFQSIFIEPSQLGTVCVILLQVQRGKWKKWYNSILLFATIISFSLGAYVYLFVIIFLNLWCSRKKMMCKVLASVTVLGAIIIGSFFYNNGDNLLQNLIIARMEVDDGELAGNNRTSKTFDKEFDSFMQSSDIFFGRHREITEFGNSGYKVFIYQYGLAGLLLLTLFFCVCYGKGKDARFKISAFIITALVFLVDGFVLWYCRFIPLFCTATSELTTAERKEITDEPS